MFEQRFLNCEEKETVKKWLGHVERKVYGENIQKLISRLLKYIDLDGDYLKDIMTYLTHNL